MSCIILAIKAIMGSIGIAISISSLFEVMSMGVVLGTMIVLISLAIPESIKQDNTIEK